jgi:DNA mismatch endonuclease (patch repair protein)
MHGLAPGERDQIVAREFLELLMADKLSPAARSAHMSRIRRSNTKPEMIVRRLLHGLGYRFRIQWSKAPGRPDVAFPGRRKMIWVHGCFWHQHEGCKLAHLPATRISFWEAKFERNRNRDARDRQRASAEGWKTLTVWECETKNTRTLEAKLTAFVGPKKISQTADLDLVR